jgi:hypothetical protein
MADDSQRIKYVFADSTNRDSTLYPYGNAYTLHLTSPLHSVTQIDLVAAKVPNTMYNLTDGSNVVVFTNTSNILAPVTSNVSIPPGYYSAASLAQSLANAAGFIFCVDFLESEGKFLFSSNVASFTIQGMTSEIRTMLGISSDTYSSFWYSTSPIYALDPTYAGRSLYKTSRIADLATNEYVFLDILELRTTSVLDAKKLVQGTTEGSSIRSTFGMIPLDVNSGCIKNYKETTDYEQYITYNSPIPKIDRLTVRWVDKNGAALNFQGFEKNAFTLRVHCEYQEPPPPTPPLQDVQIQRIVDAMMHAPPPPKPEEPKRAFGRWVLLVIVIGFVAAYVAYVRLLRPLVERLMEAKSAPPAPPAHNFKLY